MAALLVLLLGVMPAHADSLSLTLRDTRGNPVEDAVVYLMSATTHRIPVRAPRYNIDQIDKTFVPLVSVVQAGTQVNFPNKDNIRHHVYSFSRPKRFEIKLYADTPAQPILFDKPGYVVMGCNIHDEMVAHLLVVETPYFAQSDRHGRAVLDNVPPGKYALIAWYYMRPDKDALTLPIEIKGNSSRTLTIKTRSTD